MNWPRAVSATALVAAGGPAAIVSYIHMQDLSARLGADPLVAALMPFTSDGVIVAGSAVIYTAGKQRVRAPWQAWPLLLAGVAVTLVVNAAAGSGHGAGGRLLAAWPGVAFVLAFECVVQLARMVAIPAGGAVSEPSEGSEEPTSEPVAPAAADETTPAVTRPAPAPALTPAQIRPATATVPADKESAACAAYAATVAAGNPLSVNQLTTRFGLSRAQATKVRKTVAVGANGHGEVRGIGPSPGDDEPPI